MVEKKPRKRAGGADASLLARIAELEERVARLEAARDSAVGSLVAPPPVVAAAAAPRTVEVPAPRAEVTEAELIVIAATVAAFLGERAHVRQVRLVASDAWAQQGRVSVMASHRWAVHR